MPSPDFSPNGGSIKSPTDSLLGPQPLGPQPQATPQPDADLDLATTALVACASLRGVTLTPKQATAILTILRIICETIQEAGPIGIPSTMLYLTLAQELGLSLSSYNSIIDSLFATDKISRISHNITWIGVPAR